MDKITLVLLIFFLNISCSEKYKYDLKKDDLNFVFDKHIKIHFKQGNIKIDYLEFKFQDTIVFSKKEKLNILECFAKTNIYDQNNEFWYMDENSVMPPFNDEIIFFQNNKIKSKFFINFNYDIDTFQLSSEEVKVVEFKNFIKKIVVNKNSYKKANDSLTKFMKKKKY